MREHRLLSWVKQLAPDVIVVTGDYLNISYTDDATAQRQTRELLRRLGAPGGVYAITGSPPVDPPEVVAQLMNGLDVSWLRDEIADLEWHGCPIRIAGVECSYDVEADGRKLLHLLDDGAWDGFTLLLYHTPDVMPVAVEAGVDLYLAGHTHGGQLRLPLLGAVVTASVHGKRYEMGAYREGDTLLYVSRGVGMEGNGAPRARFLCPPEIVLLTLTGASE
jgi:predicted MPP superfamily phosphohydrolase